MERRSSIRDGVYGFAETLFALEISALHDSWDSSPGSLWSTRFTTFHGYRWILSFLHEPIPARDASRKKRGLSLRHTYISIVKLVARTI
jgi:hypothetical protein